jgi:hypothetical protein
MSPIAPPASATDTIVTIVVSITNNTTSTLQKLQIQAVRDVPIIRQRTLDTMLASPAPPADRDLTQRMPTTNFQQTIAPKSTLQLSYQFPAGTNRQLGGVCLCQDGVYPLDLSVFASSSPSTSASQVAWVQTYLISVINTPAPVQVSWVWSLIDRPHRLTDDELFTDDSLASSVSPGGRLYRALTVLEQVGATSRMTVTIDPELIDELAVMSQGYHVQRGATTVLGTGGAQAAAWLARLRAVLKTVDASLTPYADPDLDAAAQAGIFWTAHMPQKMAQRVDAALGRAIGSALAWPPGASITPAALNQVAGDGASSILLDDASLAGGAGSVPALNALATVPTSAGAGSVKALVLTQSLQRRVNDVMSMNGSHLADLPALMAELAIRTVPDNAPSSFIVLAADRYVDADPATAQALITATTQSGWTAPIGAASAVSTIAPVDHGPLIAAAVPQTGTNASMIGHAVTATRFLQTFSSAISSTDAATLLSAYPAAIQRCESAAWAASPDAAAGFWTALDSQTTQLLSGVQIVRPSNGSYSLGSSSAPLLVTVVNNLPVEVKVRVRLTTVGGLTGFSTDDAGIQTIPALSRHTIKVQAHVARTGHFRIEAQLLTPTGGVFGAALPLSIYSSVLGTIGVVITIVACAVLALALINRFARRWLRHRKSVRTLKRETRVSVGVGVGR